MRKWKGAIGGLVLTLAMAGPAAATNLSIVTGGAGTELDVLRQQLDEYEQKTGNHVDIVPMPPSSNDQFTQYKLWLAAHSTDIDIYRTDVIWAPQLASHFIDLMPSVKDELGAYFPSIVESQTVDGKLVALPLFTDAPALYYRKDLLDKYGLQPPKTWAEMATDAKTVMDKERAAGDPGMWGIVFQGASYEGLTCAALEWVASNGGGHIVEADGTISINNPKAAEIIDTAKGWIGTIAPPGALNYQEEEVRGIWQGGHAVFMRNWPYAYALGNGGDSPIKGKFDVVPMPIGPSGDRSAATLGGWNLAVSAYSKNQAAAVDLVKWLSSEEQQKKYQALALGHLPTRIALYDDPEIKEKQPIIPRWKVIFQNAVPRPSAPTKNKYAEVSQDFWTAVHETLAGSGTAAENLAKLEEQLTRLKGAALELI